MRVRSKRSGITKLESYLPMKRQPNHSLKATCYRPVFQAFLAGKVGV
jgi:hypothetical protein